MMKSQPTKNTLLKNAQANAKGNFFKSVFFSPTEENIFPTLPFLMNLFSPTHGFTVDTNSCASNVNRFVESVCGHELNRFGRTAAHACNN